MLRLSIFAAGLALIILGCQQRESERAADMAPESVTAVAFNATGAPTVAFDVPDMMCAESCAVKTRQILSEQPGVQDVIVDFDTKTATVAIAEGEFDADAAIAALVDHGFDSSHVKQASDDAADGEPAPQPDAAAAPPTDENAAG